MMFLTNLLRINQTHFNNISMKIFSVQIEEKNRKRTVFQFADVVVFCFFDVVLFLRFFIHLPVLYYIEHNMLFWFSCSFEVTSLRIYDFPLYRYARRDVTPKHVKYIFILFLNYLRDGFSQKVKKRIFLIYESIQRRQWT